MFLVIVFITRDKQQSVVGLCPDCSTKLNYRTKKREIKRLKRRDKHSKKKQIADNEEVADNESTEGGSCSDMGETSTVQVQEEADSPWTTQKQIDLKSRDEEMEDYLEDLLL